MRTLPALALGTPIASAECKQIDRAALKRADQGRQSIGAAGDGRARLAKKHMGGKIGEGHSGVHIAVRVEQRFTKCAIAETGFGLRRLPSDCKSRRFLVTFSTDMRVHFNDDKLAARAGLFAHPQGRMTSCPLQQKNPILISFICSDLNNSF